MTTATRFDSALDAASERTSLQPRITDLVLARVRLRARRRVAWLRAMWRGLGELPSGSAVHAEVDACLADRDAPDAEAAWLAAEPSIAACNEALRDVESSLSVERFSRLAQLRALFGLEPAEVDVVHACLALALDPSLARVYAYLNDHGARAYATESLVARLFGHGRTLQWSAESPLRRWEIVAERDVAPGEPALLECDAAIRAWLIGTDGLDPLLVGAATLQRVYEPLPAWPVSQTAALLKRRAEAEQVECVRLRIDGARGSGRRSFAAAVAAELGLPLLVIDDDRVGDSEWPGFVLRAHRQAFLAPCALAWLGDRARRLGPRDAGESFPVQFLICEPEDVVAAAPGFVERRVTLPTLGVNERQSLWRALVPAAARWTGEEMDSLARTHRVHIGDIAAAARRGDASAHETQECVRESRRHDLGSLAQRLDCPFVWDDLVVDGRVRETLVDFVFEARERATFWERPEVRRLFPQGRGLLGLFAGPPGTGKTMAAQVIARTLDMDLFRVDLSALVSKYVGETSQNVERLLRRAADLDAVILWDEADSIFGRRTEITDAHDRFANTDTSHLLQSIESYGGVALLATNRLENVDVAFVRRLRYVAHFPAPDEAQRLEIWRRLLIELAGAESWRAVEGVARALARDVEATGAQIKYAVLSAVFSARRAGVAVGSGQLMRGIEQELAKVGRGVSERERKRLVSHGR